MIGFRISWYSLGNRKFKVGHLHIVGLYALAKRLYFVDFVLNFAHLNYLVNVHSLSRINLRVNQFAHKIDCELPHRYICDLCKVLRNTPVVLNELLHILRGNVLTQNFFTIFIVHVLMAKESLMVHIDGDLAPLLYDVYILVV